LHCYTIGDVDFELAPYSVTFSSGIMTTSVTIPIINDDMLEGNETFIVNINIGTLFPKDVNISVGTMSSTAITIVDTTGEYTSESQHCNQAFIHRTCHYH